MYKSIKPMHKHLNIDTINKDMGESFWDRYNKQI